MSTIIIISVYCSECHDRLTTGKVYGITPQSTCIFCKRTCLGYGGVLRD